jgi:hypothetical protein
MRNPASDRRDVTVQTSANPAKNIKAEIALASFDSTKIASIQTAKFRKVLLGPAQNLSRSLDSQTKF